MPALNQQSLLTSLRPYRFAVLLATLLLLFMTMPAVEMLGTRISPVFVRLLIGIAFVALIMAAVYAVSQSRKIRVTAMILAAPAVLLETLDVWSWGRTIHTAGHGFTVLFLAFTTVVILRFLFQPQRVTANTIFASLCVYMLMGTLWAYSYALLAGLVPESFDYTVTEAVLDPPLDIGGSQSISAFYFSFVTMTTLGYGDIVPVSSLAKMLSAVQAVVGQMFLTVLVARLVGLHIAHSAAQPARPTRKANKDS